MTTCFGKSTGVFHIAPGGGFFPTGGMCLNDPIDAAEYPTADRLYVYANIRGYSSPNIRTVFPDGSDDVAYYNGDYMWIYWDWGDWGGDVIFELRSGTAVKATRSTTITKPYTECTSGQTQTFKCSDGSTIITRECINNVWVSTGNQCPPDPEPESEPRLPPCGNYGDIDDDGFVTEDDGKLVAKHVSGLITLTPDQIMRADIYGDGDISIRNATAIAKYAAGMEGFETFPVCDIEEDKMITYEEVCIGTHLFKNKYEDGVWVGKELIEIDSSVCMEPEPVDPCDGIVCPPTCFGTDLWSTKCVDGECVQGNLLDEDNVFNCGYVEPEPVDPRDDVPPDPAPGMAWEYIAVGVTVIVFIYYMRR